MRKLSQGFTKLYDKHLEPVLVVGILLFGFITATTFTIFKDQPEQLQRPEYSPVVQVINPVNQDLNVVIKGNGSIQAKTRIRVVPQVGGRVVEMHPSMRAGGYFEAGTQLLKIESIDYQLAVTQSESDVASAKTRLETQQAEATSARQEWLALQPDLPIPTLVSRQPQIEEAEAALKAAQARLQNARLDLQRTVISMPFDGRVVEVSTDVGDVISPNQSIGVVYSTEVLEVPVPIESNDLAWLNLPDIKTGSGGSLAIVRLANASKSLELEGIVTRVSSELNSVSRLAQIIVELDTSKLDPNTLARVIPGQFVEVEIVGRSLHQVMQIPRTALRENKWLWVVDGDKIKFVTPDIVRETAEAFYVKGLEDGTSIVTTNLEVITEGMSVRTLSREI